MTGPLSRLNFLLDIITVHVNIQEIPNNNVSVEVNIQHVFENWLHFLYLKPPFCETFVDNCLLEDTLLGGWHCNCRIYDQDHVLGFKTKLKCELVSSAWFCKLSGYFSTCRYLHLIHKVYLYVIILFHNICFEYLGGWLFWVVHPEFRVTYTPTHLHSNYMSRYQKHFSSWEQKQLSFGF